VAHLLIALAIAVAAGGCGGGGKNSGGGGRSSGERGVDAAPARESLIECRDGVMFMQEGKDATCPCSAPTAGTPCCSGSQGWCAASSSRCQFDRCASAGEVVVASCEKGVWQRKSTPCRPCPRSDCGKHQLCVTWISREGESTECVADPCRGARPLSCRGCAQEVCGGRGLCANELLGGTHVTCLIPHS